MREIYYTCPYCSKNFRAEYSVSQLVCPSCGNTLKIDWFTNGKQECGVVGTTLVYFWGATGSIKLPDKITIIGKHVFVNSFKLTEVILPDTIQEIREGAFLHCYGLQNVELSSSLKAVRKDAFALSGIQKLQIPKTLEIIEDGAFNCCSYIKEITVHKDNPYYYVENERLIDNRTKQVLATCCQNKVFYKITVESNNKKIKPKERFFRNFSENDEKRLQNALNEVMYEENSFIVCEADTPVNNITYLQALKEGNSLLVEFHLQKSPDDTAWENWSCKCDFNKCLNYFISFLRGQFAPNYSEWELEIKEQ